MKISICICTCDRPALLERALGSLNSIVFGTLQRGDIEVLVVENKRGGPARAVCEAVASALPITLRFVEEPQRGISFARNRAIEEALRMGADFVAFIDDDDFPDSDWLLRLVEVQSETGADIVLGAWRWMDSPETPLWLKNTPLFEPSKVAELNKFNVPKGGTCNALIGRRLLEGLQAQGPVFALEFAFMGGGDMDFFIRASEAGAKFAVAESSVINRNQESRRVTLGGALRRAFRHGSSYMYLSRKYGSPGSIRRERSVALKVILSALLLLSKPPLRKVRLARELCRISKMFGILYASVGRSFKYYR